MSFDECWQWAAARRWGLDDLPPTLCVFDSLCEADWKLPRPARWDATFKRYAVRTVRTLNVDPHEILGAAFHEVLVFAPGLSDKARTLLMCAVLPSDGGGYFEPVPVTRLPLGWRR